MIMLEAASKYWAELQPYRSERHRCKNYTYGRQWKDIVTVEGRRMTEEEYIREQGSAPLKNNLIRRIVRNVIGVFRNNYSLPAFDDVALPGQEPLREAYGLTVSGNEMAELYSRVLEEYLIGGLAVVRKRFEADAEGGRVMTEVVRPESFFFNTDSVDPRGWDIHTIGEFHMVDATALRSLGTSRFGAAVAERSAYAGFCGVRVTELWRREGERWRYYFLADDGSILQQGDSPFPSGGHPYVMKAYPFLDGEIHSFVADCIDQQRYINRLITLNDWIIRASAKGVLLFPEGAIPDDLDLEDIAAQWSRFNGVIRYRAKAGQPLPQQVSTNSTNVGISELLGVQLKMMEDVSGINSALQGQLARGNISGTLYEQQTRHAITGLADILEGFRVFMRNSALKDLDLLQLRLSDLRE